MTLATITKLLSYCVETGELSWRVARSNFIKVGDIAGTTSDTCKYKQVSIDGRRYLVHHLVWLLHYGKLPSKEIDHINGNRLDNRVENLREVTRSENNQNRDLANNSSNRTSKYLGVSWNSQKSKYRATITINYKQYHLGHFDTEEEAHGAYILAKKDLHPKWRGNNAQY